MPLRLDAMSFQIHSIFLVIGIAALIATICLAMVAPQSATRKTYWWMLFSGAVLVVSLWIFDFVRTGRYDILGLGIGLWVFLALAYFIGVKVVMKKGILNFVNHSEFRDFIRRGEGNDLLGKFLDYLGPVLFIAILLTAAFAAVRTIFSGQ